MDAQSRFVGMLILGVLGAVAMVCGTVLEVNGKPASQGIFPVVTSVVGAIAGLLPGPAGPTNPPP